MKDGVINIYKPQNMTSHDVVAIVRRALQTKKVGHTGTLDPMATGVLPICIGRATKIVDYIQNDKKTYKTELTLGITTDTEDCWGQVLDRKTVSLSPEEIEAAIVSFIGDIVQIPPMYSALKVNGKKLYELAREGKIIERKGRVRTIYDIKILEITSQTAVFEVVCSKGTYIRTLCADIGKKLGVGGHMSSLERTSSGQFNLKNIWTIEQLQTLGTDMYANLIPIDLALGFKTKITISDKALELIQNGVKIDLLHYVKTDMTNDPVLVYHQGIFIALAQLTEGKLIVSKLFEIKR